MNKFTVMIMSNNNHEMLNQCLDNLKKFTPFPYDVVIVDDASDPAYEIEGTTIVRMPKRSNCCNLRNVGMEMSQTEWVFWLDNDCLVYEGWHIPYLNKLEEDKDNKYGLIGQPKDARLIRNPFLPLTQADCMIEYEFAYDYDHNTRECDFITSYAVLVRKDAYRPTYCYGMPTPTLDPELGCVIKSQGYKVVVTAQDAPLHHIGTGTARPGGRDYLYTLRDNFTRWYKFWEPQAAKIWELYKGKEVSYSHDFNEGSRHASYGQHGDLDLEPEELQRRKDAQKGIL